MAGTFYSFEVVPNIPDRLHRLVELSEDLYYSWSSQTRSLFYFLHPELWEMCGHNPKLFLRRVSQRRLENAVKDRAFMEAFNRVLADYDTYLNEPPNIDIQKCLTNDEDLVAYFSLEFGLHESLPTYSGGLGILAGDHCKAASDLRVPLVAIGLLYRHGYFTQSIDAYGNQEVHYRDAEFSQLPISPVCDASGNEIRVGVEFPERVVYAKLWRAKAGHITLYLLDSDISENNEVDRTIAYQLYGGDTNTRIQQEILLGVGGVRALRALGHNPTVWHINEGHAAFQIIERCREHTANGLSFYTALDLVASATVFTTHTPVPAGHDIFGHGLIEHYFSGICSALGINIQEFLELGSTPSSQGGFNMTALALRGSRFHNGVSKIHGEVASKMEAYIWPQVAPEDNPIKHVTNGVHVSTFLAPEWSNLFDMEFGREWRNQLLNEEYWQRIDDIPEYRYWSVRQTLKSILIKELHKRVEFQCRRNNCGGIEFERLSNLLHKQGSSALVVGFARRFATYKRATLLFSDPERLARLLNNPERPVILVFAGKAHPSDLAGQQLIHTIHQLSRQSRFGGKIILLEDYNLGLARRLVTGVDVWLNTPEYPMEASGTSGQKAGINGVLNLSVVDGWWHEGFDGENGWAIQPHNSKDAAERDRLESQILLDTLEYQIIPLFFGRNGHGYSEGWVKRSKASMKTILPKFNSQRMVMDYVRDFYAAASKHGKALAGNNASAAKQLTEWKKKIHSHWSKVTIRRLDEPQRSIKTGTLMNILVAVNLSELSADDVIVECLMGRKSNIGKFILKDTLKLQPLEKNEHGETLFKAEFQPGMAGLQFYKLRVYPYHVLLAHAHETGCMIWL
ncbi:MAG: alpha-glucan phosphorylase [Gammaproteobacteria bacterium SG8_11]|nr:MAG: alpha-glucan phosphorylase [Gammaproteobacteria bacterium SG8_11]